jgi:chemotaxis protein CheZ
MLGSVADQLAAIAEKTTEAVNEIMSATEAINAVNQDLMKQVQFGGARDYFTKIDNGVGRIFEACSFHDITGQRLSRIVRTINAIEGALNSLVVIVGKDSIAALPVATETLSRMDGDVELADPQLADQGMNQDDIDKLFD